MMVITWLMYINNIIYIGFLNREPYIISIQIYFIINDINDWSVYNGRNKAIGKI